MLGKMPCMRILFITLLLLVVSVRAVGQAPSIGWQRALGGSLVDHCTGVLPTADGGCVVYGYTASPDGGFGTARGGMDGVLVKLDGQGAVQWTRRYGGSDDDQFAAMVARPEGGYLLSGRTASTNGDVAGDHHGGTDAWLIWLDEEGYILSQRLLGGSGSDAAGAVLAIDGGWVVLGHTDSSDGDVSEPHTFLSPWLFRMNDLGQVVWDHCYTSNDLVLGKGLMQTADGGFIFTGHTYGNEGVFTGQHGEGDVLLCRLDPDGDLLWSRLYGGSMHDSGQGVIARPDGGFRVAATTYSTDGDVASSAAGRAWEIWVLDVDAQGGLVAERTFGRAPGNEQATDIIPGPDGSCVIAGFTTSTSGDITFNHGASDVWLFGVDLAGDMLWQATYGGSGYDSPVMITTGPDDALFLAAGSSSNDGDVSGANGAIDMWVVRFGPVTSSIHAHRTEATNLWPVPSRGKLFFRSEQAIREARIFNGAGQCIWLQRLHRDTQGVLDVEALPAGMYVLELRGGAGVERAPVVME